MHTFFTSTTNIDVVDDELVRQCGQIRNEGWKRIITTEMGSDTEFLAQDTEYRFTFGRVTKDETKEYTVHLGINSNLVNDIHRH